MVLFGFMAVAMAAAAQPTKLHTFKDWIVGCDNVRACQANLLAAEADGDDYVEVTLNRGAKSADRAVLYIPLPDKTTVGTRFSLKVDGGVAIPFSANAKQSASLPLTGGLLATLRNGRRAVILDAGGGKAGAMSLAGLAAALRYIDDQQGRTGTVGALIATGSKPDAAMPAPPPYPEIVQPPPSPSPPRTISVAAATRLIGQDNATCDYATGKVKPRSYRLDATHSLVLVDHPCGNGAYNFFTSVYVLDEAGTARPAHFDVEPGMIGPSDGTGELTNGDWDPKTRQLSSFEKGRGLGDCGTTESYVWNGASFRLLEQDEMDECRASVDYIRTWIAKTRR